MPALHRVEAQAAPAQEPVAKQPVVKKPVAKQPDQGSVKPATNMAAGKRSGEGGTGGGNVFVKVLSLVAGPGGTDKEDVQISEMAISTLQFASKDERSFRTETTLQDVRTKLQTVLKKTQTFKFCSDDCAAVPEDISLDAYSKLLHTSGRSSDGMLRVYVAASQEAAASQLSVLLKPPFQLKFIQMGDTPGNALNMGALHSSAFKGQDPSHMPMGQLRRLIGKMSPNPQMNCFCSLDGSLATDELSLREYLDLDNEPVGESDGTPSVVIRYRKTDAKVAAGGGSKFHAASAEVLAAMEQMKPDLSFKDRSAEEMHADTTGFKVTEELDASQFAAHEATPLKYTSQMDEADWDAVLRNCALLYGWRIDKKTNRMVRATTPAFRLRNKTPIQPPVAPIIEETPEPTSSAKAAIEENDASEGSISEDTYADTEASDEMEEAVLDKALEAQTKIAKALTAEDVNAPIPAKLGAIPSYVINDRSRIEVTTVVSEFQESMAKNHFSSTSVEASVSGGYAGFSVGVTGGVASESSSGQSSSNKTYSKRMVASYMFPRVSVFLRPEDLEPTQELRDALDAVRKTKNINMLRYLYQTFGQLFCYTATLGGCLQTTKIVTGTEQTQQSKEKESFKASVGVAFSTPFGVSGSVKTSHETQDSSESFQRSSNTSESMTFEATGGNSILAANPPAWSSSVADFNNWRVIDQSELHPISETISQIPGYGQVQAWFFSAVPKLSQYVVIPESRVIHVRFKAISHSESPALERITGVKTQGYLGHVPDRPPKPIRTSLERISTQYEIRRNVKFGGSWGLLGDITVTTRQVKTTENEALFFPHCTQAPVLMFPGGKEIGTSQDPRLLQTVWRLEVAQGYALGPDCLVSIKSCAPVSSSSPSTSQPELGLTVYRNAQGLFQPAITNSDEPSYWRIQAVDPKNNNSSSSSSSSPSSSKRDPHRHGDLVRLTWSFADQPSGFRDYYGDVYGRRSYRRPEELGPHDTLCLKVPYPRFENPEEEGVGLVMSTALTQDGVFESLRIRPLDGEGESVERTYNLHDLCWRLDPVGNGGVGDAGDFMNVVTDAHGAVESYISGQNKLPLAPPPPFSQGSPESVVAGIVLGPLAAPVLGVVASAIGSIFGF